MRVDVPREMFNWARERAGMDVAALVKRFPQLTKWEAGDAQPTLKQLERFAKATYAPIGFFFLKEPPPPEKVPIPDFRTVANQRVARPSPNLLDTVYVCQQRQAWYHDYARAEGEQPLAFVGSARVGDDVVATATRIREALHFDLEARRQMPTWTDALRRFIDQADALGVLVMVSGVVGSNNRRTLDPDEFRGFALADDLAPLVFVNGADTKAAQMFTLAHELVHIWIGQTALSNAQAWAAPDDRVERWSNEVAAELLVPLKLFRADHFYRTGRARVSRRFARALIANTLEGQTTFTEAGRLLGIRRASAFDALQKDLGLAFPTSEEIAC